MSWGVSPEFTDYSCIHSGWKFDSFCGSYEGLVCICYVDYKKDEQIVVLNRSTTEFKEIHVPQKLTEDGKIRLSVFWFGYDYKIADYKLVRVVNIDRNGKERFEAEVYALGFDCWRKIQSAFYIQSASYKFVKHQPGVLVNGALHWFVVSGVKQVKVLVSFDISSERFVELSLPKERLTYPEETLEDAKYDKNVGELGGCLCLLFHVFGVRVDVWVMQEYGVRQSWTKTFTINGGAITKAFYLSLKWSFSNNKIILQCDDKLILYDSKNRRYRKLAVLKIDTYMYGCS
ncbi:F-box/kelch-repeat protein At3g06240-like [Papaver somniferum]|uniref:F-box/kelch-repeat protein At3g06240-like n=1 Tax=Papaver somniferum TaxID=3469 RepID=UPI000E70411A|nr:F-box/kelch-repeat protein At3g06240-like [Papaver somniferum]